MSALSDIVKAYGLIVLAVIALATMTFFVVRWGVHSLDFFRRECQRDEAAEKSKPKQ
jgi:hypothetical protein